MKLKELIPQYGEYEIKDLENIKSFLEKPEPKTVWDLKDGDICYVLYTDGDISKMVWHDKEFDYNLRKQLAIFLTIEDAEYEKRKREVYTIVKKHSYDFSREEWEDSNINKFHPYYDHETKLICYECNQYYNYALLYFKSKEDVKAAIEEVGEADFIKYYLGVKDYE